MYTQPSICDLNGRVRSCIVAFGSNGWHSSLVGSVVKKVFWIFLKYFLSEPPRYGTSKTGPDYIFGQILKKKCPVHLFSGRLAVTVSPNRSSAASLVASLVGRAASVVEAGGYCQAANFVTVT